MPTYPPFPGSASDFSMLANQFNPATQDQGSMEADVAIQQIQKLADTGARMTAQSKANEIPAPLQNYQVKTKPDGSTEMSISGLTPDQLAYFQKASQFYQEALGGYAQEAQRLEAQRQQVESQPWMQLATALSANLAAAPGMPGWVQGLGRTAAQLNPTADELRARQLAVLGKGAEMSEKGMALGIAQERTIEDRKQREQADAARGETQRKMSVERALDNARAAITAGTGDVDGNGIMHGIAVAGATDAELESAAALLGSLAANVKRKFDIEQGFRAETAALAAKNSALQERRIGILEKASVTKATEKSEEQKDLEALAQSLAAGELTSLRTVASMRGGRRERVFRLAREINPAFNTGEIERKINMEQSFTVGKDGIGLQSFDTFLQHAGEVTETLKGIEMTDSKLLNQSLNWWRRNMKGTPELARLETSLEPVAKEFESFLLNQRALYSDDRRKMDALLNPNQPLKVTMATLGQMGKTAKDRFAAMNQRYKRVMGQDLENPFSPEAIAGSSKIGMDLLQETAGAKSKYPWEK